MVDQATDPELYRRVAEAFPDAWIEDPALTPETDPVLEPHRDRITWDAPIHSVADIEALPFPPRTVNIKPSRFGRCGGSFRHDYCDAKGIGAYGGGQFELGPAAARSSTWPRSSTPDAPNDVAPSAFNETELRQDYPEPARPGFEHVGLPLGGRRLRLASGAVPSGIAS